MEDIRKVFVNNLERLAAEKQKRRIDIANDLHISIATVSDWFNGKKFPRAEMLEIIADYFGCKVSDLLDEPTERPDSYYINKDADDYAQFLFDNPEYRVLFDASRKVSKEDIAKVAAMIGLMSKE